MGCEKGLGERKRRLGCVFLVLLRPLRDLAYSPIYRREFLRRRLVRNLAPYQFVPRLQFCGFYFSGAEEAQFSSRQTRNCNPCEIGFPYTEPMKGALRLVASVLFGAMVASAPIFGLSTDSTGRDIYFSTYLSQRGLGQSKYSSGDLERFKLFRLRDGALTLIEQAPSQDPSWLVSGRHSYPRPSVSANRDVLAVNRLAICLSGLAFTCEAAGTLIQTPRGNLSFTGNACPLHRHEAVRFESAIVVHLVNGRCVANEMKPSVGSFKNHLRCASGVVVGICECAGFDVGDISGAGHFR